MPQKSKDRNPRVSKGFKDENTPVVEVKEPPQCHVHDEVNTVGEFYSILANVCQGLPLFKHTDGKHYCLFHLPDKEKDNKGEFEKKFRERLKEVEDAIAKIEELPEEEREEAERGISYDFRYVWFPSKVYLRDYKFQATVYFISATFLSDADFQSVTFMSDADFSSVKFVLHADFQSATFSYDANFYKATFKCGAYFHHVTFTYHARFRLAAFPAGADFISTVFKSEADFAEAKFWGYASFDQAEFSAKANFYSTIFPYTTNFKSAKFTAHAEFYSAKFTAYADFSSATFKSNADFTRTKFGKKGITSFQGAVFEKDVLFYRTRFRNDISFDSTIFGSDSDIFFQNVFLAKNAFFRYCSAEGYMRFSNLRQGKENKFDFQEAAFEKASRVSFHTVHLYPSWFVNIDSRKFVLTNIDWKNLERKRDNSNVIAELKKINTNSISEKKHLLEIACRQLAVNAEENNRYEEASKFRYMAMETKRLEYRWQGRFWTLNWWYRFSSDYGENWKRAALVLLLILLGFGLIYTQTNFQNCPKEEPVSMSIAECKNTPEKCKCQTGGLNLSEAVNHSIATATFQNIDYRKPLTVWGERLVILEKIFAPLQAALLALAIRRKFMR